MRHGFEEYVRARGDALRRFAYLLCGDRHLGEDLVQEVLIKAYRRWSRIGLDVPAEHRTVHASRGLGRLRTDLVPPTTNVSEAVR